ncbi:hypothetical protein HCH_03055 [Hahella chejuensis KCTC 2396]|uniref:Uncharacterized protein n=1 Tax=Hahella chejuensis (strain KCTC 2396) TaxID=349521 RepID=Q2SHQ3_HAHCH|nr:hypothetical protein [Hahella chejuensis]ABC29821.1 hypothetical protein HCH_03055 [Hahella chejuensis KCTC 2396]
MIKKTALFLVVIVILVFLVFRVLGPYLRELKSDETVALKAIPVTYNCARGNCIAFDVESVGAEKYQQYVNKLIYPYSDSEAQDEVATRLANLLSDSQISVCMKGVLHQFPIDYLRPFHKGYGGYDFQLMEIGESACEE